MTAAADIVLGVDVGGTFTDMRALDVLTVCQRNLKPCPGVGVFERGIQALPAPGEDIDVRTEIGGYHVWSHGELEDEMTDVRDAAGGVSP